MDLHTLHVEHVALLGIFTLLMVVNSTVQRGARGARWFAAFNLCAFIGAILITLRGQIPDFLSIALGNFCFSVGYLFLHRSLTEFFDRGRYQLKVQLLLVAVCAGSMLAWAEVHPDTPKRLLALSVVLGAQVAMSAYFALRRATGTAAWSIRMMGGVLLLLSANNLFRVVVVLIGGAPANYLHGGAALAWVLLGTSVLQGAVTIAYVWMTAARLRADLETQASTDPLTRLLNRRALTPLAEREMRLSEQSGVPLSAILIDLDEFKSVNDLWGHHCGDAVLVAVARCLEAQMRTLDRLARHGGDEFVVMLPRTSRYEALDIAERLRGCVEELHCKAGDMTMTVRASFGVAEMQAELRSWEQLLEQCDKAMYRVKAKGGNQVLVH